MGVYPIRIQTDDGISNPFLLAVGQLPQVAEKEDNSTFETAQLLPSVRWWSRARSPAMTSISSASTARRGRSIVVDAQCARIGSGIDPTIRLTTAGADSHLCRLGRRLAGPVDRCPADRRAPRRRRLRGRALRFALPGSGRPVYRLVIGAGADGRGDLSAGRPRRGDGRPGASGRHLGGSQDRRGDA